MGGRPPAPLARAIARHRVVSASAAEAPRWQGFRFNEGRARSFRPAGLANSLARPCGCIACWDFGGLERRPQRRA
eukprot:3774911-Alexandrium_andersonii.AAC.1